MDSTLALAYKSRSQIARVITERWGKENLYCAACNANSVGQHPNNTHAIDFTCGNCSASYQLKSGSNWNETRIPDAGYQAMIRAIRSDKVPNLLVMQYGTSWNVKNLMLVPSFFFTESAIQKRPPLGPTARRAGWVGCNILLSKIAPEGKIRLVFNEIPSNPAAVRVQYKKIRPIAKMPVDLRGWALNVLRVVHKLGKSHFSLDEIYAFEAEFSDLYPKNRNVLPKIRQQLQVLRDIGLITFLDRGNYLLSSKG